MSSKAGGWCCRISLIREIQTGDDDSKNEEKIEFGPSITEPRVVSDRILRAQVAILYPDAPPSQFWEASSLDNLKESMGQPKSTFSSDSILLEIEGPEVTDLSFVDLPGKVYSNFKRACQVTLPIFIGLVTNKKREDIDQVEALVTKYISNDACLILLVYTCTGMLAQRRTGIFTEKCTEDIANQGGGRFAQMHDPTGERTIGTDSHSLRRSTNRTLPVVLTKPDLVGRAQHDTWLKMVKDSDKCFCVRQPDRADLLNQIPREKAREQEMEFFRDGEYWKSLYNSPLTRARLGTKNLADDLHGRLLDWIVAR